VFIFFTLFTDNYVIPLHITHLSLLNVPYIEMMLSVGMMLHSILFAILIPIGKFIFDMFLFQYL